MIARKTAKGKIIKREKGMEADVSKVTVLS
jgi:hypothetical protein